MHSKKAWWDRAVSKAAIGMTRYEIDLKQREERLRKRAEKILKEMSSGTVTAQT